MPARDIVVIGASAGGLNAVRSLLANSPPELTASLFLVIHTSPDGPGLLAAILNRVGTVRVVTAADGAALEHGVVYVAPPDLHLLFKDERIQLSHGPREHRFRPAIDPMFRSAAEHFGDRVIGVVLSGYMGDGTHGLMVIKRVGGIAIVQDPEEAMAPTMPMNAIAHVEVDHVLPVKEIGILIAGLVMKNSQKSKPRKERTVDVHTESPRPDDLHKEGIRSELANGSPSPLTCPDCGGTLWEFEHAELLRYRCHVGHGFSAETLGNGQREKVEDALWTALRAIEEAIELRRRIGARARDRNLNAIVPGLERDIAEYETRADALRDILMADSGTKPVEQERRPRPRPKRRTGNNGKPRR